MKVTLGGERLGSGKKMDVEMRNYERSTHDLSFVCRTSMAAGTLVPCMKKIALPGDTWDINISAVTLTLPTVGPLFGSYKQEVHVFKAPIRLYQGKLHNNATGIGMDMSKIKLPELELTATKKINKEDIDNSQINAASIFSYLGIRGVGIIPEGEADGQIRKFNAIPWLMYWDVYKQYFANKQEKIGAVIHTEVTNITQTITNISVRRLPGTWETINKDEEGNEIWLYSDSEIRIQYEDETPDIEQVIIGNNSGETYLNEIAKVVGNSGGNTLYLQPILAVGNNWVINRWRYQTIQETPEKAPGITTFPLENIDKMRERILAHAVNNTPFSVKAQDLTPYSLILRTGTDPEDGSHWTNMTTSQEGLGLKTYNSDLYNNWLDSEWISGTTGVNAVSAVSTAGDQFTIDALNLASKVYEMLNRIAVSDGSYDAWMTATWGHTSITRAESPVYMGGLIRELVFEEVVSTADTGNQQPLGTLAGKGRMSEKNKGGNIYISVDEPSYIMAIVCLTPRIDYSQGNDFDTRLTTMNDLHMPALDQIGFQDLIQEDMAWWTTKSVGFNNWEKRAAGKQPAWINYMTSVNKTFGTFAEVNSQMFMTLNRRYEMDDVTGEIKDLTTYVDPSKYNNIFAETRLDAQNFWTQVRIGMTARRKMSAKIMPNL